MKWVIRLSLYMERLESIMEYYDCNSDEASRLMKIDFAHDELPEEDEYDELKQEDDDDEYEEVELEGEEI